MLKVSAGSFCYEYPAKGEQGILADCIFVVFEIFDQGLGDGSTILSHNTLQLCAEIVYQLATLLHLQTVTFLISALGSSRHFASALASSGMWKLKESLNERHPRNKTIILSRRSSLFSGKGVLLMRWMRPWMSGSDYYFLRGASFIIF